MFGYLWMCLRLSDIDPICAKSNGHSLVFISLHFLASSGPLTLASLSPRSQFSFILHDRSISASTANPPYSVLSLCRPRTRPIHARPHSSLPPPRGFLPQRASHHDRGSLEVTGLGSEAPQEISYSNDTREDSSQSNCLLYLRPLLILQEYNPPRWQPATSLQRTVKASCLLIMWPNKSIPSCIPPILVQYAMRKSFWSTSSSRSRTLAILSFVYVSPDSHYSPSSQTFPNVP